MSPVSAFIPPFGPIYRTRECYDVRITDRHGQAGANASASSDSPRSSRRAARGAYVELFSISFSILFLELACIRWFGSQVMFLTFFSNLVLMACLLGMSVGLLAAARKQDFVGWVMPVALTAVAMAELTGWAYARFGSLIIDVGRQEVSQQVFFGTEARQSDLSTFVVPIELIAAAFFAAIALMFVGLGQAMGRALAAAPDRVTAYSVNVLGSLIGIAAFGLASYLQTSPVVRFAAGLAAVLPSLKPISRAQAYALLGLLVLLAAAATRDGGRFLTYWSPYYKVTYHPKSGMIEITNIGHR